MIFRRRCLPDLGREGRSRLVLASGGSTFRQRLSVLGWPARCIAALVLAVAVGVPLVIAVQDRETFIHINEPLLRLSGDIDFAPGGVQSLVGGGSEARHCVINLGLSMSLARWGRLAAKPCMPAATGTTCPGNPRSKLQIALRCTGGLCVFAINREHAALHTYQQGVLFPDMPISQWRVIIRSTTSGLFQ